MSDDVLWGQQKYVPVYTEDYIAHHGIKGQKWGVRRFQDIKGRYTELGRRRYLTTSRKERKAIDKEMYRLAEENAAKDAPYVLRDLKDKSLKKNRTAYQNIQAHRMKDNGKITNPIITPFFIGTHSYNLPHTLAARENRKEVKRAKKEGKKYVEKMRKQGKDINKAIEKDGMETVRNKAIADAQKLMSNPNVMGVRPDGRGGWYVITKPGTTLQGSRKVEGQEASDFWKSYAAQAEKEQKRKKR